MSGNVAIVVNEKREPVVFQGLEGVDFFRLRTLRSALGLLKVGIKPNRNLTATKAFKIAGQYTGKNYKRGQYDAAMADIQAILEQRETKLVSENKVVVQK